MDTAITKLDSITSRLQKLATDFVCKEAENYVLSLRVAGKLLYWDTYQDALVIRQNLKVDHTRIDAKRLNYLRRVLLHAIRKIDMDNLKTGSPYDFLNSVKESVSYLKPIDEFAKEYTVYLASNAHIDLGWLWRWGETVQICRGTFNNVLDMMKEFPDFTFSQSQAVSYEWMEKCYPEILDRIKIAVQQGRWEVVGGMYVEPDCNLINGESWARQLLYGQRYLENKFGKEVKIGWNPDSFGYNWNMPQFLNKAGIDKFITQKIGWNDTNVFPYHMFWWQSPDGSRVLTYFPYKGYNMEIEPFEFVKYLKQFEVNTGLKKMLVLYGVGDHGGGPTREMLKKVEWLKTLPVYPRVEYITAEGYFRQFDKGVLKKLPVWKGELYLEYCQGTYTTQAKMKENNRKSENMLTQAETFSSIVTIMGLPYPYQELKESWLKVLFNQFHDILPGSSIRPVYQDAEEDIEWVQEKSEKYLNNSLKFLSRKINTQSLDKGKPLIVFNSLSWPVDSLVELTISGKDKGLTIVNSKGKKVISQIACESEDRYKLIFMSEQVPSIGYSCYQLIRNEKIGSSDNRLKTGEYFMENDCLRVEIDKKTGLIASIYDKKFNRQVLSEPRGNLLQLLEDKPRWCESWNIGLTGRMWELERLDDIEIIETGPVRAIIRIKKSFLGQAKRKFYSQSFETTPGTEYPSSFFSQDIILYRDSGRVDFCTRVDWWEDRLLLKVAFPVNVRASKATYEIPFGHIQRPTTMNNSREKAMFEVSAINWVDISAHNYGVSMLSRSKYGFDIHHGIMRMTLLKSPASPEPQSTPDVMADRGKHIIWYSILPHRTDWRQSGVVRAGWEYNVPLTAVKTGRHRGTLLPDCSFIQVQPENVILAAVKKAEDSDDIIMRLYESWGKNTTAQINLFFQPKGAYTSDFLERPKKPVNVNGKQIRLRLHKHETATLIVKF